jgi:hypothetical protein
MLPNFTVVICGAVLTVLMLAVAGSGLIDPQTRTRIGAMPEIGRPMMQGMITEPAARGQFAALETSRRAEELMRLRDLAPAVAEPAPSAEHDDADQPAVGTAAPAPQPPSDPAIPAPSAEAEPRAVVDAVPAEAPAAAAETAPAAAAETAPAAVAPEAPGTDAAPVAIAEPPPTAAEAAPPPDTAGAPAPEATTLAVEPAVGTLPAASQIEPPPAGPESVATAPPSEAPEAAEHSEAPAEPSSSAPQQLALAEPDAVPTPEPPAKLAARTGEPEESAPVRRWAPRFVPRLPRIIPALSRVSPPRLAHAPPRVAPILVRRVHVRARLEAAKPDVARAALVPKKPVRHWVRQMPRRAQRASIAPNPAVSPYPTYSGMSGVQYR